MNKFEKLIKESIEEELINARNNTNTNPTEGQAKAGNYKKGKINYRGFYITIENPKNSVRKGTDANGKSWSVVMRNDYGYFNRTVGKDGDAIDVFLGNNPNFENVYVVDQKNKEGNFDESKVMLGFSTKEDAKNAYFANYEKGWKGFMQISGCDIDTFKEWLYDGYKQRKPFCEYKDTVDPTIRESSLKKALFEAIKEFNII